MSKEKDDLSRTDLRWMWLAITLAGGAIATYWLSTGGELYRSDESGGVAGAAATTARFAVLLALGAAAVDLVGMLAASRTHYVPGGVSLVCSVAAVGALLASVVHANAAADMFGYERDPMMPLALGAMVALAIGGLGLWFDARAEHRRAVIALARIEHDIHAADHDLM
ncbi:MAG TPA: hypothetical protein VL463_35775 [Kofleriaceae bacterium]|jgi:hypothetical protein|nr:hypothetical protein [Kofleriaceae bacterium]